MSEKKDRLKRVNITMDLEWTWPAGEHFTRFFHTLGEEGVILGIRCPNCKHVYLPPRPVCGDCYVKLEEWVLVPARSFCSLCYTSTYDYVEVNSFGRLVTWTALFSEKGNHSGYGIIKLDGASTGFVHKLKVGNSENLQIGLKMEAVFNEKRTGSLNDILYFKPANGEGV